MKRRRVVDRDQITSETGSPVQGEPEYLAVGRLRRPHGIQGEILMDVLTDFPERLKSGKKVYLGEKYEPVNIRRVRWQNRSLLVELSDVDTEEEAGRFRNWIMYVRADELPPLPEGNYYHHDLIGLRVQDEAGKFLGVLEEIIETGANDVYVVVDPEGKELLLPALDDIILQVNLPERILVARPPVWE